MAAYGGSFAWVSEGGTDTVQVVDLDDDSLESSISVGSEPRGVAVHPDGGTVYITNYDDDSVAVIDTSNNSIQRTITVGRGPYGVALDPAGTTAYVTNELDDTLSVIRTSDGTVTATIDTEDTPRGVVVDPDNDYVFVACFNANQITIVATDGHETVAVVSGTTPFGVAVDSQGERLYVTNYQINNVSMFDIERGSQVSLSEVAKLQAGTRPVGVALSGNDKRLYVANSGSNSLTITRLSDAYPRQTVTVGTTPFGVAAPKNGDYAYAVNNLSHTMTKVHGTTYDTTTIELGDGGSPYGFGNFIGGEAPTAPSNLEAVAESMSRINLTWEDRSDDEVRFRIERRRTEDEDDDFQEIALVDKDRTSYQDGGLSADTEYTYRILASSLTNDSGYSNQASATTEKSNPISCFLDTAGFKVLSW